MNVSSVGLSQHQWLRINEVILEWHSHTELRTFPQCVLAGLHRLFSADTASFSDTRGGLASLPWQALPSREIADQNATASGPTAQRGAIVWTEFQRDFLADRDAFIELYTVGQGHSDYIGGKAQFQARRVSDDVSLRTFRNSQLFATCYDPIDREMYCSARLPGRGNLTCAVSRSGRDFSESDVFILELLRPHLEVAYRRALIVDASAASAGGPTPSSIEALQRLGLTPREAEILCWVSEGKTNPEIALILSISRGTVKTHVERILQKLACDTRTSAARQALEVIAHPRSC